MAKVDIFLDVMMHSADQTHLWHLQTTSYAMHQALGGYYDGIRDGMDDVAEKCMGHKDVRLKAKGGMPLENFSNDGQVMKHLETVEKYLKELNIEIGPEASHIVNAVDVLRELVAKTKYLLTLK